MMTTLWEYHTSVTLDGLLVLLLDKAKRFRIGLDDLYVDLVALLVTTDVRILRDSLWYYL